MKHGHNLLCSTCLYGD